VRRVLVSAYACDPTSGSEPGAGWSWVVGLAEHCDVTVLTRVNNADAVRRGLADAGLQERVSVETFDLSARTLAFKRRRILPTQGYYFLWQLGLIGKIRELHSARPFDLVHHVTFGTYWMPSGAALSGLPCVIGPAGGAESTPRGLLMSLGMRGLAEEVVRRVTRDVFELLPAVRRSLRQATVIPTTSESECRVRRLGGTTAPVMAHVGFRGDQMPAEGHDTPDGDAAFRVLVASRLIAWKGQHLAIAAFAEAGIAGARLTVLGSGPEEARLRRIAASLNVADRCDFIRRLPSAEDVEALMRRSDVLVHLATHESGGMVVAEAMGCGLPCIVLDHGGPALLVKGGGGVAVPSGSRATTVSAVAQVLRSLADDTASRTRLGECAHQRVLEEFSWGSKVTAALGIYEEVFAMHGNDTPRTA